MIIATAGFFGWVMVNTGVGGKLVDLILTISTEKWIVLSLLIVFLLVIGCVLDVLAMIFIFIPVMIPPDRKSRHRPLSFLGRLRARARDCAADPTHGAYSVSVTEMAESSLSAVLKDTLPFLVVQFAVLLLVAFVPALSTWLPSLLLK